MHYGFEAGAQDRIFGKPLKELNLEEAALLAAVPKSPEYSPTPAIWKRRRMRPRHRARPDGVIFSRALFAICCRCCKAKPDQACGHGLLPVAAEIYAWDYPIEEIRKYLEDRYTTRVAQGGLKVYTTINVEAQQIATKTIRERLRAYDRGREWRSDYQNILVDPDGNPLTEEKDIEKGLKLVQHADWYGDDYDEVNT
jgi:penicillin-binding protein 1A